MPSNNNNNEYKVLEQDVRRLDVDMNNVRIETARLGEKTSSLELQIKSTQTAIRDLAQVSKEREEHMHVHIREVQAKYDEIYAGLKVIENWMFNHDKTESKRLLTFGIMVSIIIPVVTTVLGFILKIFST